MITRRHFLRNTAIGASAFLIRSEAIFADSARELKADVVILGGGVGGCAAALGALRNGKKVILTEETDWIGGQLTQQGVPPDEHPWIETFGCTRAYRRLRDGIRDYYREHYPLTESARAQWNLNPGAGSVSRICHEPRVSLAVLRSMFAPYLGSGSLRILLNSAPIEAEVEGDFIRSVSVQNRESGRIRILHAPYFIDATEMGDLLPMAGVEYVAGAESQSQTGEMHAPSEAQPQNMQACTWCFAMDYIEGEDHTIDKPEMYEFWRDYTPELTPPWPDKLLSWMYSNPSTLAPRKIICDPGSENTGEYYNLWRYRRIAARRQFTPGAYASDITIVNWPQNDYLLGNVCDVSDEEKKKHMHQAMQLSLSLMYWMQTEAPRLDGKTGWPGLRLRGDILGTEHGLAKFPYIRESRRIEAEFTVLEEHIGAEMRAKVLGGKQDDLRAESFSDSVGLGSYRIDLHPSTGGDNYIDFSSLPFEIPLGALIPKRVENLIAGCKNLGVTHLTNGPYRMHPVEWNIGESAGLLAAYCIDKNEKPRGIRNQSAPLRDFQRWIMAQGVEIRWPSIHAL
ncbi:MAG: FAD-dependent oxidoreductase [Candidatus Omnitrophica bacterium]|nr:FAD-dependent oxidoreductase [Candidatus Omnitrophota bacterium]